MVSQHAPRQGDRFLMFSTYQSNDLYRAYNATETYRVVPLGGYFPSDELKGKTLEEQIRLLLQHRLEDLTRELQQGAVEIDWLEQPTLQALQRGLRRADYHVFHYVGHGGYDRGSDDGVLALEDGTGRSRLVSGMELGTILADEMTLRLAVLNACEGARSSAEVGWWLPRWSPRASWSA